MKAQLTSRPLRRGLRTILFASMVIVLLTGVIQPVSAGSPPSITEGDSIFRGLSKNGTPYAFSLTLHATDPDAGDTLTWSVLSPAGHGTAAASGTGLSKAVSYSPNSDYIGDDSFVVQVNDGTGGTDTITVNVSVAPSIGMVVDTSVDDHGFNWYAYQGLIKAETQLGTRKTLYEALSPSEYLPLLEQCADDGNKLCFGVGFVFSDAILAAANARPGTKFGIIDAVPDAPPSNLRAILFNEKQVGYLAGALAGKMTTSQVIGVVGGMNIAPAVVRFVEGYRNGAQCANPNVKVLIQYAGTFGNPGLGATIAQQMIANHADVIFGAAGPTGNGAIQYSAEHNVWSIGVDTDQYISLFGSGTEPGAAKVLTSAMKMLENVVYSTILDYMTGSFTSGSIIYDLAKDGVGLAPYHEAAASIPLTTKNYVSSVRSRIIGGTTNVNISCRLSPASAGGHDGWILESSETSGVGGTMNYTATTMYVGDNAQDKQYRSILSFNTAPLPDNAVITKVQLRIRQQGITGQNPFLTHGGLSFDIRKGNFYTGAALQLPDFQSAASLNLAGTFPIVPNGGWYTVTLSSTARRYINRSGYTQFRLRFNLDDNDDSGADALILFSGNAAAGYRPQLLISYRMP